MKNCVENRKILKIFISLFSLYIWRNTLHRLVKSNDNIVHLILGAIIPEYISVFEKRTDVGDVNDL